MTLEYLLSKTELVFFLRLFNYFQQVRVLYLLLFSSAKVGLHWLGFTELDNWLKETRVTRTNQSHRICRFFSQSGSRQK